MCDFGRQGLERGLLESDWKFLVKADRMPKRLVKRLAHSGCNDSEEALRKQVIKMPRRIPFEISTAC